MHKRCIDTLLFGYYNNVEEGVDNYGNNKCNNENG